MSRTEKLILLATALLVLAATVLEGITPKEPDWNPQLFPLCQHALRLRPHV
jgi:hypothetical protein